MISVLNTGNIFNRETLSSIIKCGECRHYFIIFRTIFYRQSALESHQACETGGSKSGGSAFGSTPGFTVLSLPRFQREAAMAFHRADLFFVAERRLRLGRR